ncbi:MAG TPA: SH3 domain-containing protein [Pyrinomonadaceae bacterium]
MKLPLLPISLALVLVCFFPVDAQKRRVVKGTKPVVNAGRVIGNAAFIIDERLSVLRIRPSLFAASLQRMRRGRRVQILAVTDADGVRFFKVRSSNGYIGWVQSDAVFGKFRPADEARLAGLVLATDGFERIELANAFLTLYPASRFRPAILLLFGDLIEEAAARLTKDAGSRLSRREMAATGAPLHSYYLNFNMLDRYRRAGVLFLFNPSTRNFHYDGASWKELVRKYPSAPEAAEATKRLYSLKEKLDKQLASN